MNFKYWKKLALNIDEVKSISVPIRVLLDESALVSGFVERYYEPEGDRPGLKAAAPEIHKSTAEEIMSLRAAVSKAQAEYLRASEDGMDTADISRRARAWKREIRHIIKWAFRPGPDLVGVEIDRTSVRRFMKGIDRQGNTSAAMTQIIHDYAIFARTYEHHLTGVPGFDSSLFEEADWLVAHLYLVKPGRPRKSERCAEALDLRCRLTTLLSDRIRTVRTAARFVFRNHKEIIREATSAYERTRRLNATHKKLSRPKNDEYH